MSRNRKKRSNVLLPNVCRFALLYYVVYYYIGLENQIGHKLQQLSKNIIHSKKMRRTNTHRCVWMRISYVDTNTYNKRVCYCYVSQPEKKNRTIQQENMWKKIQMNANVKWNNKNNNRLATALTQNKKKTK